MNEALFEQLTEKLQLVMAKKKLTVAMGYNTITKLTDARAQTDLYYVGYPSNKELVLSVTTKYEDKFGIPTEYPIITFNFNE